MDSERKTINVKWNGKAVENIKAYEGQPITLLKRTIEDTCGVPAKKQKLLFKGKFLKDDDVIEVKMFDKNQSIMLMGAAGSTDVSVHLTNAHELINAESQITAGDNSVFLGTGLKNLGNTCYVNSTLQVLFGLDQELNLFNASHSADKKAEPLYESFISTLKALQKGEEHISPLDFIMKLRSKLPIYAEKDKYGLYIQHDVHEFWSTLISYIGSNDPNITKLTILFLEKKSKGNSCFENVSYIFLPVTSETSTLSDSLLKSFSEKASDSDEIISTSSFSYVPAFLPFVFMRFMWKTNEKVQAKILKLVSYPKTFDILSFASESLKSDIQSKRVTNPNYGIYKLNFLITHTGRESDSGHYMAWSKVNKKVKSDEWFKFDDDKVSIVKEDEIMKLGGGGDRPTAYMIFYIPAWSDNDSEIKEEKANNNI